jgi:hypothetical protein
MESNHFEFLSGDLFCYRFGGLGEVLPHEVHDSSASSPHSAHNINSSVMQNRHQRQPLAEQGTQSRVRDTRLAKHHGYPYSSSVSSFAFCGRDFPNLHDTIHVREGRQSNRERNLNKMLGDSPFVKMADDSVLLKFAPIELH